MRFGDPAVGEYADATARRSVAHLTITKPSWRSVQTCSVLLRTEAGGMPAFQSVAASRRTYVVQRGHRRKPTTGSPKRIGKRKVGNRPPGGYVGASRQPDRQNVPEFLSPKTKKR
jgi:hypothetical protein